MAGSPLRAGWPGHLGPLFDRTQLVLLTHAGPIGQLRNAPQSHIFGMCGVLYSLTCLDRGHAQKHVISYAQLAGLENNIDNQMH